MSQMGTHIAKFATSLQRDFPELRGGGKRGENRGKQKGGAPQSPDQGTGAKARTRGRRGGKSKKVLGWVKALGRALDKVGRNHPLRDAQHLLPGGVLNHH